MKRKHNPNLTPRAKELRKAMTEQERKLWHLFLKNYPVRFLRQKIVDRFIVDFYCAAVKLVVELDGSQHFGDPAIAYDTERTYILNEYGLDVIRFTNHEVDRHFTLVCEKIHNEVKSRKNPPAGSAGSPL